MGKQSHPVIIPAVRPPLPRESRWSRDLPPTAPFWKSASRNC